MDGLTELRSLPAPEGQRVPPKPDRQRGGRLPGVGFLHIFCGALVASACASYATIPVEDRRLLERDLQADRFLRLSFYVTPFFGDTSKKLLTTVPPEDVRVMTSPRGEPVNPGPVESILRAGTKIRITKVEFPTAFAVAERPLQTPRTQPWIYLHPVGRPNDPPLILVLRPQIRASAEFEAEVERYLSHADLSFTLSRWPETVQQAVRTKTAIIDMPAEALEMAWGYPEKKRVSFVNAVKSEQWLYSGERRQAYLVEGRIVRLETGKTER
jgi:hypothetical protein